MLNPSKGATIGQMNCILGQQRSPLQKLSRKFLH